MKDYSHAFGAEVQRAMRIREKMRGVDMHRFFPRLAHKIEMMVFGRKYQLDLSSLERTIAMDPHLSFSYAYEMHGCERIHGWEPGDEAIAEDAEMSLLYATEVIGGAFPKGEASMKGRPDLWERYTEAMNEFEFSRRLNTIQNAVRASRFFCVGGVKHDLSDKLGNVFDVLERYRDPSGRYGFYVADVRTLPPKILKTWVGETMEESLALVESEFDQHFF